MRFMELCFLFSSKFLNLTTIVATLSNFSQFKKRKKSMNGWESCNFELTKVVSRYWGFGSGCRRKSWFQKKEAGARDYLNLKWRCLFAQHNQPDYFFLRYDSLGFPLKKKRISLTLLLQKSLRFGVFFSQARTVVPSVQQNTKLGSNLDSLKTNLHRRDAITAACNSSLGMLSCLRRATLVRPITQWALTFDNVTVRAKIQAAIAFWDASAKTCSCICALSEINPTNEKFSTDYIEGAIFLRHWYAYVVFLRPMKLRSSR